VSPIGFEPIDLPLPSREFIASRSARTTHGETLLLIEYSFLPLSSVLPFIRLSFVDLG